MTAASRPGSTPAASAQKASRLSIFALLMAKSTTAAASRRQPCGFKGIAGKLKRCLLVLWRHPDLNMVKSAGHLNMGRHPAAHQR